MRNNATAGPSKDPGPAGQRTGPAETVTTAGDRRGGRGQDRGKAAQPQPMVPLPLKSIPNRVS